MFRNLAANLVLHDRIETTDAKAKELRRVAEKLITKATRLGKVAFTPQDKLSDADKARRLHAQRLVASYIPRFVVKTAKGGEQTQVDIVEKVFLDLAKRFQGRPGGYTRIVKLGPRRGDAAQMSLIEFVGELKTKAKTEASDDEPKKTKKKASTKKPTAAAPAGGGTKAG